MNNRPQFLLRILTIILLFLTIGAKFFEQQYNHVLYFKNNLLTYVYLIINGLEMIAAAFLFFKRTLWMGALLTVGLMIGSLYYQHLEIVIDLNRVSNYSFYFSLLTWVFGLVILWNERENIPFIN